MVKSERWKEIEDSLYHTEYARKKATIVIIVDTGDVCIDIINDIDVLSTIQHVMFV